MMNGTSRRLSRAELVLLALVLFAGFVPAVGGSGTAADVESLLTSSPVSTWVARNFHFSTMTHFSAGNEAPPAEYEAVLRKGEAAVPDLIRLLASPSQSARVASFSALAEITNQSFGALYWYWSEADHASRWREQGINKAMSWWAANKDRSRLDWLLTDLASSDPWLAAPAATKLGLAGDSRAIKGLFARRGDTNPRIREELALALARLGHACSAGLAIEALLVSQSELVRKEGIAFIREVTGAQLPFDPSAALADREQARVAWEAWWAANSHRFCSDGGG